MQHQIQMFLFERGIVTSFPNEATYGVRHKLINF